MNEHLRTLRLRRRLEEAGPVLWQLAAGGGGFALAAGGVFGGLHPFGLSLVLGVGQSWVQSAAAGAALGYLALLDPVDSLRWLAALASALAGRWLFRTTFWPAAVAGSGTLLLEASATGIDTSQPLELVAEKIDPASYMLQDSRFPAAVPEEPLETETTEDGDVVLRAGQNPQTSPDTDVVRISSAGYDGAGNFHIRLAFAEGITGMLLARPCNAAGEPLAHVTATEVEGGMDCVAEDFDLAELAYIQVYGPYRGPEPAIQGEWTLPLELEAAEQTVIQVGRTLEDGVYVDRVEVSGMNIAVFFQSEDVDWFTLWVTDQTGETFPLT